MALPHDWVIERTGSGRVPKIWCWWCRDQYEGQFEIILDLMWALPADELFDPEVNEAVAALVHGREHPLLTRLLAEISDESD